MIDGLAIHREILANGEVLRRRYLDWVQAIQAGRENTWEKGESDSDFLRSHLLPLLPSANALTPDSLAASVIRFMALIGILNACELNARVEVDGDAALGAAIRAWSSTQRPDLHISASGGTQGLATGGLGPPWALVARALLRYVFASGRGVLSTWRHQSRSGSVDYALCVLDYTSHMKADPFKQSGLTSRIWASLPDEAEQQGKHVLWLHKFVATSEVANKKAARSMLAQINATSAYSTHVLLDDFVYVRNVLQGARALGKVARRPGLLKLAAHFPATSDVPDLTDLLSDQAMDSAARLLESQAAYKTWFSGVSRGHRADAVILLSEGQAWEYLVPSLAESMHARRLYYFVNATVGFWGLRFMNGRLAAKQSRFDTLLLVSRHQTLSELKSLGTSLADSRVVAGPSRALRRGSKMAPSSGREAQSQEQAVIALFADYDPESAALLADMVFSLPDKLRSRYRWVLQPHPANPLKPAIPYELEDLELWTRDSAALLGECEVVLTTYGTSMTLTSLEYGKPTAVVGDTDRLPQVLALDSLAPWIVLGADDLSAFLGAVEDGTYAPVRLQTPVNEASEVTWQSILREMAT